MGLLPRERILHQYTNSLALRIPLYVLGGGGASHVWAAFFPPEFEILSELVYNFQLLRDFVHGLSEFIALRQLNVQSYSS